MSATPTPPSESTSTQPTTPHTTPAPAPSKPPRKESTSLLLSVICAILITFGVGLILSFGPTLYQQLTQPNFNVSPSGIVKDPPKAVRDFVLTDQNGQALRLSDLRGKPVMLFFGYTHCPDVCPVTIADFVQVKKKLGEQGDKVSYVMVSVDGERDTPEVLKNYMKTFDTSFIGLTGSTDQVRGIAADFGANFQKQQTTGTSASYLMAHTSFTYLLDGQGRWRLAYPFGTPTDDITKDVQAILSGS